MQPQQNQQTYILVSEAKDLLKLVAGKVEGKGKP